MVRVDLDRTNLGNARLQGLPEHVLGGDPTGVLFDWANSAFFFSYVSHPYAHLFFAERFSDRPPPDSLSDPGDGHLKIIPSSHLARMRCCGLGSLLGPHGACHLRSS